MPDVALNADDANSPVNVLDSYANGSGTGWELVGGTSEASPLWAGVIAVANQVGDSFGATTTLDTAADSQQTLQDLSLFPPSTFTTSLPAVTANIPPEQATTP